MPQRIRKLKRARALAGPDLRAMIDRQIVHLAHRHLGDFERRPLLSLPPEKRIRGALHLGNVLYEREKWPAGLRVPELLQNLGIFGRSGSGKTNVVFHLLVQLSERKIPWVFLDWKRTARHLIPHLKGRVKLFTPGRDLAPLPFNPLIPPPGLAWHRHVNLVLDSLSHAYTLGDGARNLLQGVISECKANEGTWPTFANVLTRIESSPQTGRSHAWRETALRALRSLIFTGLTPEGPVDQRQMLESVANSQAIVELEALDHSAKRFLVPLLTLWLYHLHLNEPEREQLKMVLVIEEAHHTLHSREPTARESTMEMIMRQCREIGVGIVVVDQHPHLISPAALGNLHTTICMNQRDTPDRNRAASLSLVEASEKSLFGELPVGQGVVKMQDRWTRPFLVKFPLVDVKKGSFTDADVKRLDRPRARSGGRGPEPPRSERLRRIRLWENPLEEDALRLLEDVTTERGSGVGERYKRLGLSAGRGDRLKSDLITKGWLEAETIETGNTRKTLLRLSASARDALGVKPGPGDDHRASLAHEYWKHHWADRLKRQGYRVILEAPRPGGRMDILALKGEESLAVEIETGKSDVVKNVREDLEAGIDTVMIFCVNSSTLGKIQALLRNTDSFPSNRISLSSPRPNTR